MDTIQRMQHRDNKCFPEDSEKGKYLKIIFFHTKRTFQKAVGYLPKR